MSGDIFHIYLGDRIDGWRLFGISIFNFYIGVSYNERFFG